MNFLKNKITSNKNLEDQSNIKKIKKPSKDLRKIWLKKSLQNSLNTFWHRSKYEVKSPYDKKFREKDIHTKARPIQINQELLKYCENEIQELLNKKINGVVIHLMLKKQLELERGTPRLAINYKSLNDTLRWIDEMFYS